MTEDDQEGSRRDANFNLNSDKNLGLFLRDRDRYDRNRIEHRTYRDIDNRHRNIHHKIYLVIFVSLKSPQI